MTQLVPLERSRWDESNDIKEGHQWWLKYTTQAVRRQISPNIFDWLVWPTPVTVYNLPLCRWIRPVDIFPTISVVSLSELRCVSVVFFFSSIVFLSFLSPLLFILIVNCVSLFLALKRVVDDTAILWTMPISKYFFVSCYFIHFLKCESAKIFCLFMFCSHDWSQVY